MLIGIDSSRAFGGAPTGTETYSREMIRALLQIDSENQYRLYTRERAPYVIASPNGAAQSSSTMKIASSQTALLAMTNSKYELRSIPFPRLWTHTRLALELLTHPPDLLWVPAHVLPLAHPRCSIVTIHDLGNLYFPEAYPKFQRWYHEWSEKWNARAALHLFADSQATKDDLVRFLRVPPKKITVVYPAYDAQLYRPVRDRNQIEKVKARLRVDKDYVITIGTIHPRKNHARLIEAFQKSTRDNCQLLIVGKKGWQHREILAGSGSLGDRVKFLGYVPDEDMPALVSGARLFVLPSLHEGFGLPILEAQACGVPVACSSGSSLPEAAGDDAIFFDPRDVDAIAAAIQRGLTDESLRARLIERGLENVKRFGWEKSARTALDVMNEVGSSAPTQRR